MWFGIRNEGLLRLAGGHYGGSVGAEGGLDGD